MTETEAKTSASAGATAASDFDVLPYPSLPQSYTQPSHLAALAQLHGLRAPPAETARVLELGCASGGNIIPLAARFPKAHFTGFDLSARQIADGQRRIAALSLSNIDLEVGDVTHLPLKSAPFDYIICHGLFSWVPVAAQEAIFQICREHLASSGVAAISYNVLPGWHLRRVIRDICLQAAGVSGSPRERATRARRAIEELAGSTSKILPYGYFLRQEVQRLSRQPLAYIFGEFLAEHNTPVTLAEFVARASGYDLKFLCEGDLDASARRGIDDAARFAKLVPVRDDRFATGLGSALDYASGRPFRRSLIVHSDAATSAYLPPHVARLRGLHVTGKGGKSHLATVDKAFPSSVSMDSLIAGLEEGDALRVCEVVLTMVAVEENASLSTLPIRAGRADSTRPSVSALNRLEAASGQPWISSLHHGGVPVTKQQAALIKHLDGTLGHYELAQIIDDAPQIDATLTFLERNGVLQPDPR